MESMEDVAKWLDQLYAELAEIKRYVLLHLPAQPPADERAWSEFLTLSEEVSALWSGPSAVDEIRDQREK